MKFLKRYCFLFILPLALLAGCDEELPVDITGPYNFSFVDIEPGSNSAVIRASYTINITPDPTVEVGIMYEAQNGSGFVEMPATDIAEQGNFTIVLTGLAPDTKYFMYCYAKIDADKKYLSRTLFTFTTEKESGEEEQYAVVASASVSEIAKNTAMFTGTYTLVGSLAVSEGGFNYRKNGDTEWTSVKAQGTSSPFVFSCSGLAADTKYDVEAWVKLGENVYKSASVASFTTMPEDVEQHVEVALATVSGITSKTAVFTGTYTATGVTVSEVGFKYRKNGASEWTSVKAQGTSSPFTYTCSGLTAETQYEVTAWVKTGETIYESASTASFTTTAEGTVVVPTGGWAELPVMTEMDNVVYVTHYVTSNGQSDASPTTAGRVRNYTLCYDTKRLQPLWAAYPMHPWYDGGVGRNDTWKADPYISSSSQPDLSSSYKTGYSRGHQVASSDRQKTVAMNKQTFYYSNMSPQVQNEFNGGIWNSLEIKVQNWGFNCSDTLYVVTGSAFIGTTKTASDKSGNTLPVPTHFFKVVLSSKTGKTGKPISQLSASELKCVGFWFGHFDYGTKDKVSSSQMKSVAEIESLTGFSFFPMLSESAKGIKSSYSASDWGM